MTHDHASGITESRGHFYVTDNFGDLVRVPCGTGQAVYGLDDPAWRPRHARTPALRPLHAGGSAPWGDHSRTEA